mmetsp:Transcript_4051/g.4940  ORF Transcript_4051/g.4940 Transcript_4051/m.4940 type:complete len:109 (+) Transcript_4051:164-490(+)|eukprot:CAMPEP_0170470886 /NCGR_PEP_ID=MMETSP0123-20130129/13232_1 /TAXON_ID=182087 /ORGANISM="Favella ehrenbergii, Strain Fehren 1" /LENGTH=108 /DNA_ID=CAMNT_0010738235 /DNA_START=1766 /DNA_END=2092 /DNA_ORIENTATION=-
MIGSNKRTIQVDYLKKVLHSLEYQAVLPQGESYFDLATRQSYQQLAKADVPKKVVAFSCGGGSFVEYDQIKQLNEEKCSSGGQRDGNGAGGADDGALAQSNKGKAFFD